MSPYTWCMLAFVSTLMFFAQSNATHKPTRSVVVCCVRVVCELFENSSGVVVAIVKVAVVWLRRQYYVVL